MHSFSLAILKLVGQFLPLKDFDLVLKYALCILIESNVAVTHCQRETGEATARKLVVHEMKWVPEMV